MKKPIAADYPAWICAPCGQRLMRRRDERCMTFHEPDAADVHDHCGWCGTNTQPLTEPRDYGYPLFNHPRASVQTQEKVRNESNGSH